MKGEKRGEDERECFCFFYAIRAGIRLFKTTAASYQGPPERSQLPSH